MAARMSLETDIMGEGSVIYSWASYDQVLDEDTIRELADAAVPTELPEIEVDPEEVIASSFYAHLNPKLVDFGELSESATYVFSFKAAKGGASTAIAGNDSVALKLDQWNEQGIFGLTVFGVADHVFEPVGEGSTSSVFDENVHVAYVNDLVLGETRLYVNGTLAGKLAANFELTGEAGVMAARLSLNTDPMANGSIMYNWATYNSALSDEAIAALASEAVYYDPTGPHTSPIVVDFGPLSVEGLPEPYTFEFFFNAQKAGVSTAIAGDDSWALKLDQWNEQGIFGITEFGVMDYVFEVDGQASVESVFGEDVHVVMVNDVDLGECRLYIDGEYAGYIEANFNLSGPTAVMAARLNLGTDPMGEGSVFYYWDTHAGVLSQEQIKSLYANAETRDPVDPVDPTGPEVPDGALDEPTLVDLGDASLDSSLEFSFNAIKAGASTAIAGNDSWALKLDQWNEQGVFGMTEFGVMDYVFEPEGPGDTSSIFEEDVHVVFVNDVSNGETRLYVNGLYAGYIEANFMLSGETALMAARLNLGTDPMAPGSLMYSWKLHPSVLSESEIAALASPNPVDPTGPEVPDGALDEPTLVDLGDASLDSSLEFSFNAIKAGASTAIAGNDSWALKLDQWNEQGVFGMTEFGVMDYVFEPEGPGDTSSIFEEDVHVVFVNDVSNGETRLYVNGLYAGYIEANFMLSGETALMAARLNLGTDPMAPGSLMYSWKLHPSVLSESEIAALASPKTTTTMSLFKLDFGANQNDTDGVELTDWDVIGNWTFDDFDDGNAVWALSDFGAGTDTDVTLTIVDNDDLNAETGASPAAGMIGNNPTQENIDVIYDGIEIPYVVKDDYLYRNPDTAGTELLFQVANLDPGTYNVTLFEGRTTDQSQVARMWVGDASGSNEPSQPNTGSFSGVGPDGPDPEGFPQTLVLDIGAGDYLWYAHMEDNSGGISGMIIRAMSPSDAESGNISSVALTDGNVVIEYTGTLKSSVSVTGPFDDVPAATSPFTVPTTKAAEFFIAD